MLAVTIVLAVLLAVSLALVARRERERRRALAALGGGSDLAATARAAMGGRSDRAQLDAALALRDAIMEASPTPVLLFDTSAHLVRANSAARDAIPDLQIGATAALQRVATAVHEAPAGRQPRPFEATVYEPEPRPFHAHLPGHRDPQARA